MHADRILIVGCGYVGSVLGVRLAADGHPVWGLRRRVGELPNSLTAHEADLQVPKTLRYVPDVDVVVYLAAAASAPHRRGDEQGRAAHVQGLRFVLGALEARGIAPRRLLYGSCVEVFGATDGRWVDEDSEAEPGTPRGQALLEGEALAREARMPATIVRLGRVYGPGRLDLLGRVARGEPLRPDEALGYANLLHRDDAVGILRHLALAKRAEGTYVAVDREPVGGAELAEWLAAQLGRPAPAVDAAAGGAEPPPSVRCMSERIVEAGYRFAHPTYREGFRPLLGRVR